MNKFMSASIISMALLTAAATAMADNNDDANNPAYLPMTQVLQNLQNSGYPSIYKIDLGDNMYEAKVVSKQGAQLTVEVDPKTGNVTSIDDKNPPQLSILYAAKKVEAAGYTHIYNIDLKKHAMGNYYYQMSAYDSQGDKVDVEVNAITGIISKD